MIKENYMENLIGLLTIFSVKDSNKRVTFLKTSLELLFILLYSVYLYNFLFGEFDLINPTDFPSLYKFVIEGNIFISMTLFVSLFLIVRYGFTHLIIGINYIVYGIVKYIRRFSQKESISKFLRKNRIGILQMKTLEILVKFDVIRNLGNNVFKPHKYYNTILSVMKVLYHESKNNLLKRLPHNVSLIIQFCIICFVFITPEIKYPVLFNTLIWVILFYAIANQLVMFFIIKIIEKRGYEVIEKMEGFKRYDDNYNQDSLSISINPDKPIFNVSQNKLIGRDSFSQVLFESIRNYKGKECLVIGIDGEWGEGKTSFVNMSLEGFTYNFTDKKYVMFFNPWNFITPNELTTHFLHELNRFIKKIFGYNYTRDLEDKILLYINYITNGSYEIPEDILIEENDTETLKKEIQRILREIDFKLIIVIDDLDRLDELETKQVLKFVKLIGDFPNIIYIIPFDKQRIIKECDISDDYLKKIIQIDIKLPPIISTEIYQLLNQKLELLLNLIPNNSFDEYRWSKCFNNSIRFYLKNIRDVNRLINTLRFYLSSDRCVDLNITDFVILTTIQTFDGDLYNFIGTNKTLFTSTNNGQELKDVLDKNKEQFIIKGDYYYNLLSEIFTQTSKLINRTTISDSTYRLWRRENRICSHYYFDKYFLYPIDKDKILRGEMEDILTSSKDYLVFRKHLLRIIKDDNYKFFISRVEDYIDNSNIEVSTQNIVRGFLSIGHLIKDSIIQTGFGVFTQKEDTLHILSEYFKHDDDLWDKSFLQEIFRNKKNDVHSLVRLFFKLTRLKGIIKKIDSYDTKNFNSNEVLIFLHNLIVKRLRKSLPQIFNSMDYVDEVLYEWRTLDSKNDKIDDMLKKYHLDISRKNFISFFDKLRNTQWIRYGLSQTHIREIYDIDYIKNIVDIDYLKQKSDEIKIIFEIPDYNRSVETIIEINQFSHNKNIFDKCVSGEIDPKDTNWGNKS